MRREEAIAKFGVSYATEAVPFEEAKEVVKHRLLAGIHDIRVVERLGADSGSYKTPEEAARAAADHVAANIRDRLKEIGEWEGSVRTKLKIAAAKAGLRRDSGEYLQRVAAIRETAVLLMALEKTGVRSETKTLPTEISLPLLLDVGRKVYRVEAYYLERAMDIAKTPLTEHTITGISLKESWWGKANGKYDYLPEYHLDNGEHFTLPADDITDKPISTGVVNYNYFLTKEGAQAHMRDIAQRITNAMKPYLQP